MYTFRFISAIVLLLAMLSGSRLQAQSTELNVAGAVDNLYFLPIEEEPAFAGHPDSLLYFISDNTHYPQTAIDQNVSGTVYVSFVILENGDVSNVKVFKGIGSGCDEEAIRIIKLTNGHWLPGKQKGRAVKVFYNLPVRFSLT